MILITTHKNTDFDALASSVCAGLLYPESRVVLPGTVNPNVRSFLSIHKDFFPVLTPREVKPDEVDQLIVVDVNQWNRLDRMKPLKKRHKEKKLVVHLWDHHMNEGDILADWGCQEAMGANITLMIRSIKEKQLTLSPIQATLFLAGLYEDTGHMMFPSTTPEDAMACAYLLENHADLSILSTFLRPHYGEKQKNVLFEMLKNPDRRMINGYTVSINRVQINGHVGNLSVVVHMFREILNVDAAFGIFADKEGEKAVVIGRSNLEEINIGSLMRGLGGGGHPGAGSAMIRSVNPDTVEEMLVDLIRGNQQASVQISDLMSFPVVTVSADATMAEVDGILKKKGCTGLPVIENNQIVGMISRRDFAKIRKNSQLKAPVKAFMSRDVVTIEPGKSPMQAARMMVRHDVGRLPVVENDKIIGIVARSDVMVYFYDLLPS